MAGSKYPSIPAPNGTQAGLLATVKALQQAVQLLIVNAQDTTTQQVTIGANTFSVNTLNLKTLQDSITNNKTYIFSDIEATVAANVVTNFSRSMSALCLLSYRGNVAAPAGAGTLTLTVDGIGENIMPLTALAGIVNPITGFQWLPNLARGKHTFQATAQFPGPLFLTGMSLAVICSLGSV